MRIKLLVWSSKGLHLRYKTYLVQGVLGNIPFVLLPSPNALLFRDIDLLRFSAKSPEDFHECGFQIALRVQSF